MQNNQKCSCHNETIIGYTQYCQERRGLCLFCLAEQTENFVFTQEASEQIRLFKKWFKEQLDTEYQKNNDLLRQIIENFIGLKNKLSQQIDKLISHVQEWIIATDTLHGKQSQQLVNLQDLDFEQIVQENNKQHNQKKQYYKEFLEEQLLKLELENFLQVCQLSIKEIKEHSISFNSEVLELLQQNLTIQSKIKSKLKIKCPNDDQQIIMLDLNKDIPIEKRLACVDCISRNSGQYVSIKDSQILWNKYESLKEVQLQKFLETTTRKVDLTKKCLQSLGKDLAKTIASTIDIINQEYSAIQTIIMLQQKDIGKDWQNLEKLDLMKIAECLSQTLSDEKVLSDIVKTCLDQKESIKKAIRDSISGIQQAQSAYYLAIQQAFQFEQLLKPQQNQNNFVPSLESVEEKIDEDVIRKKRQYNEFRYVEKINYKLLDQCTIQQKEECQCLCFNKENNILIVGCNKDIKIFQFEYGWLTQIQLLGSHTHMVNALYICNQNQIISCCSSIKIWNFQQKENQLKEWKLLHDLKGHVKLIFCLVVKKDENSFFTGSYKEIKCWVNNQEEWACVQTLSHHSDYVNALSLNDAQTQLLSFGEDYSLNIYTSDGNNQWSLFQSIAAEDFGYRASYIGDSMIAFQLKNKGILKIYETNSSNKEFSLLKDLEVTGSKGCFYRFPLVFCKQQSILINKHTKFIYIIRIKKDKQFEVEQVIEFSTDRIFGTISDDGQYLVTWDGNQKQFEIRQLQ